MLDKTIVGIVHHKEIGESPAIYTGKSLGVIKLMLDELLKLIEIKNDFISGKKVLIKPNLVRPDLKRLPASTTDPRVIIALCELCLDFKAQEVWVGENPGFGYPAKLAFRASALKEPLKKLGVKMVFFDEDKRLKFHYPQNQVFKEILSPESLFKADVLINLPKMKTHMHTLVSLSMKNMQGIVLDEQRMLFHRADINHKIVDTLRVRMPDLNIIDGIWAAEGQAPFHGDAVKNFNVLIGGRDIYAVDLIACEIMGIEPEEVNVIRIFREAGYSYPSKKDIVIKGINVNRVKRYFKRPVLSSAGAFKGMKVIEGGVCSGCLSALRHSLDRLQFEEKLSGLQNPITIFLGKPMPNIKSIEDWENELILFGNCAIEMVFCQPEKRLKPQLIAGCPPHVLDFYQYFLDNF